MTKHRLYHAWRFETATETNATICPDGCRDILVLSDTKGERIIRLTDWDFRPRKVVLRAGTRIAGYRLRPGTSIPSKAIDAMAAGADCPEDWISAHAVTSDEVIDALIEPGASVPGAAKSVGVTMRTLQRRLKDHSLPPPEFWRLLGRARRAASMLPCRLPLADIAFENGYSDQAHMTREFKRWFAQTPSELRRNKVLLDDIAQPALGNWTGEQISMR